MFDTHQDIVALTVQDHQERIIAGAWGSRRTTVSPSMPEAARKRFGRVLIALGEHLGAVRTARSTQSAGFVDNAEPGGIGRFIVVQSGVRTATQEAGVPVPGAMAKW